MIENCVDRDEYVAPISGNLLELTLSRFPPELLEIVLVAEAVVAQDLAVAPELLDEAVAGFGHEC
jgi:hypothetical protein